MSKKPVPEHLRGLNPYRTASEKKITLEDVTGEIARLSSKVDKFERDAAVDEVRGVSSSKPLQLSRGSDYVESRTDPVKATHFAVTDRRESYPNRANLLASGPRGDLPLQGRPVASTKEIEVIRVGSMGRQTRSTATIPSFESPPQTYQAGGDLGGLYESIKERAEAAPPYENVETTPTKGGIVSLQDSVEGLKRSLDKITGKTG